MSKGVERVTVTAGSKTEAVAELGAQFPGWSVKFVSVQGPGQWLGQIEAPK